MTAIEWVRGEDGSRGETWNPTLGCDRVSEGCRGCYAIRESRIRSGNPHPAVSAAHAGLTDYVDGRLDWTGAVRELPARLTVPLSWSKPRRVFVDSLSDLFHSDVSEDFVARVWATMALTRRHTYLILTKRHGPMRSMLRRPSFRDAVEEHATDLIGRTPQRLQRRIEVGPDLGWTSRSTPNGRAWAPPWPLPNVGLGVSVEDQAAADLRIPALLDTAAAVRFLSCEPLIGPVDLSGRGWFAPDEFDRPGIAWVIAGGESGPGARPMHPDWPSRLRDQAVAAGVAFHFKQWGAYGLLPKGWHSDAPDMSDAGVTVANDGTVYRPGDLDWPDGPRRGEAIRADHGHAHLHAMYRVGKHEAGRDLADRTWDEFPAFPSIGAAS